MKKIREWLALDYRSLAVLRIAIGLTIICDLVQRALDLRAFYSDQGVLSRLQLLTLGSNKWWVSLHMMTGLTWMEGLLFIIAGTVAIQLILGYRTQLAVIVSWFLLASLHFRNPMVLQGGDVFLRVTLFWMMFLPLGRAWSLDRLFNRTAAPAQKTIFSAATVAYVVQVCLLYVFSGMLKSGAPWHDGTAIYYALNLDQLVRPFGVFLRGFPQFMSLSTHIVWYIETFGVILFFSPYKTGFFRTMGILLFLAVQIVFNSTMHLGLFGMIVVAGSLGLLPSVFWDSWFANFSRWLQLKSAPGLSIYYDADCTFCAKMSFLLKRTLFLHPETIVRAAEANPAAEALMREKDSWVVVDAQGIMHTSWDGLVAVISHSATAYWLRPLFAWIPIKKVGEKIYRSIAQKRTLICLPEPIEPAVISKPKRAWNILISLLVLFLLAYAICWNIDTLGHAKKVIPENMQWIGLVTHLDQKWNMFAPRPLTQDGWYVFPGTLRDNTPVDVFSGKDFVTYAQPAHIADGYKNQRWQKYLMNLWSGDNSSYRAGYAQYLCREWNASHSYQKQLMTFQMMFMLKNTPAPGETPDPIKPTTIWTQYCF